ncbi:MAG: signal peptide peptidase SppA [Desulfobacterales bacterium]
MDRIDFSPGRCWGMVPEKFERMLREFRSFQQDPELQKQALAFKPEGIDGPSYEVVDGVAVIGLAGPVTNRMTLFAWLYGAASLPRFVYDLKAAADDPKVRGILLDIDSPGGTVGGVDDAAQAVLSAREKKPVVAYTGGMMTSAAYWIGSAAGKVVASRTADLGSIGVFMVHEDWSKFDERVGITTTVIKAGKYKAIHLEPLTSESRAEWQREVDVIYNLFIGSVAGARGVTAEYVREYMAEGRVFIGQDAVDAGLADRIGTIEEAIELALPSGGAGAFPFNAAAPTAETKETVMEIKDVKQLEAAFPELVSQVREAAIASVDVSAAREEGRAEGVQAERDRVVEILGADGDMAATVQAIKDGTSSAQAYKAFYEAEKSKRAQGLTDMAAEATSPVGSDTDTQDTEGSRSVDQKLVDRVNEIRANNPTLSTEKAFDMARSQMAKDWKPALPGE